MNEKELMNLLRSPGDIKGNTFLILKEINRIINIDEDRGRDLVLRALEFRELFGDYKELLEGLVRSVGLFPYLDKDKLNFRDAIAFEFHRPLEEKDDIVFHREQAVIYRRLLDGDSVVLSAPTSFGKSRIIDAIIALKKFRNIAVIVPTIALIDETRKRLTKFENEYKIITQLNQSIGRNNLFIFTAERANAYEELPFINFFVIDEFYKIGALIEDSDRTISLNQIFYKLLKQGGQFYLLGPNIDRIPDGIVEKFHCVFYPTKFSTVVSDIFYVPGGDEKGKRLLSICSQLKEKTLIYCKSPNSVNEIADLLIKSRLFPVIPDLKFAADWFADNFHPDWLMTRGLRKGILIHHGRLPRSIAQYAVREFNEGTSNFLICTSTLIEGVNTKAKNVIVYDKKIGKKF